MFNAPGMEIQPFDSAISAKSDKIGGLPSAFGVQRVAFSIKNVGKPP
jgi:hypothetical protein